MKLQHLPFITITVHQRVHPPVEQPVLRFEAADPEGTGQVVFPATLVRPGESAQPGVFICRIALTAPLGPGEAEQVRNVAFGPAKTIK